jgi:Leucine Rich repeat
MIMRAIQDVAKLCAALDGNTTLLELSASGHAMAPETAAVVSAMLTCNSGLQALALGDSSFGDAGVAALCPGLAATATLQRLDLSAKGMTATGAISLGRALAACSSLTQLSLAGNRLGGGGIGNLTPGLLSLRSLDLRDCCIASAAGGPSLSIMLRDGHFTSLDLSSTGSCQTPMPPIEACMLLQWTLGQPPDIPSSIPGLPQR